MVLEEFRVLVLVVAAFVAGAVWESTGWRLRIWSSVLRLFGWSKSARCRIVGAGPGDAALLTIAAKRAIHEADVVIADRLVSEQTLALVRGELIMSRKVKGCANKAQEELHQWTLEALKQGKDVVRLKGGDPFLYGRGAEEIHVFRKAGFSVEVIPGISSAFAAPMSAGIALTTRGVADQVMIATGHGMNDSVPKDMASYNAGRTTVYLMSVGRMQGLMKRLLDPSVGYPFQTPVAVIEKATTLDQRTIRGTIETIYDLCKAEDVQSPATIVVGRAAEALLPTGQAALEISYQHGEGSVKFFCHQLATV